MRQYPYKKVCFSCPEEHDLQTTEVLGQMILLCKDCLIDWNDSNTGTGTVEVTFKERLDP